LFPSFGSSGSASFLDSLFELLFFLQMSSSTHDGFQSSQGAILVLCFFCSDFFLGCLTMLTASTGSLVTLKSTPPAQGALNLCIHNLMKLDMYVSEQALKFTLKYSCFSHLYEWHPFPPEPEISVAFLFFLAHP
jgi:hypothetical protein